MTQILTETSKQKIIAPIHNSWNLCMHKLYSVQPQADYRITNQYSLLNSGLKIALLNRVMKTNMTSEEADQKISEVKQLFGSKSLPFIWQVDPGDKPADLPERLEKAGFTLDETRARGFGVYLN